MNKSNLDEALVTLYLRLNGYFTSGLVVHSSVHGRTRTDVDCLAIRLPHHSQLDRVVDASPFVAARIGITDLLVCEVKSDPAMVRFNAPLKNGLDVIADVFRWAGVFTDADIDEIAPAFQSLVQDATSSAVAQIGIERGNVRVRALLCCPAITEETEDRWCLTGSEILRYANECLNPAERRASCSVRYNFQQWTHALFPLVEWLKKRDQRATPTVQELYSYFSV